MNTDHIGRRLYSKKFQIEIELITTYQVTNLTLSLSVCLSVSLTLYIYIYNGTYSNNFCVYVCVYVYVCVRVCDKTLETKPQKYMSICTRTNIYANLCTYIYIYSHPQTDLFRSIRTHQCGKTVATHSWDRNPVCLKRQVEASNHSAT